MHDLPHHRARHILQPTSECCTMLMLLSSSPPSTLHANNFTRLTTHRLRDICRNLKKGRKPILNMMKLAVLIALSALCSASAAERSLLQAGLPNFPRPASPPPPPSPPITPGTPPPPPSLLSRCRACSLVRQAWLRVNPVDRHLPALCEERRRLPGLAGQHLQHPPHHPARRQHPADQPRRPRPHPHWPLHDCQVSPRSPSPAAVHWLDGNVAQLEINPAIHACHADAPYLNSSYSLLPTAHPFAHRPSPTLSPIAHPPLPMIATHQECISVPIYAHVHRHCRRPPVHGVQDCA